MGFSWQRGRLLSLISQHEPLNVTELSKLANISVGTSIYRHLRELEKRKLITMTKDSKNKKVGNPTILRTTNKAKALNPKVFEISDKLKKALTN